jgi:hypothetical protein
LCEEQLVGRPGRPGRVRRRVHVWPGARAAPVLSARARRRVPSGS